MRHQSFLHKVRWRTLIENDFFRPESNQNHQFTMDSFLGALRDISFVSNVAFKSLKISESVTFRIAKEFALIADCVERKDYDLFLAERVDSIIKCAATTAKGESCKKTAATGETFCKTHLKVKSGCAGLTTKGTKCKKASIEGSEFCKIHEAAAAKDKVKSSAQNCGALTSKGAPCKRKAISDTKFCKTHQETDEDEQKDIASIRYCSALTSKDDAPCKKRAILDTEFCKAHGKKPTVSSDEKIKTLCKGLTAKGKKCKRAPLVNSEFCAAHGFQNEEAKEEQEVADLLEEEFENSDREEKQVEALEKAQVMPEGEGSANDPGLEIKENKEAEIKSFTGDYEEQDQVEDNSGEPKGQDEAEEHEENQEISDLLEEAFEEIDEPAEPFDTYEVDPTGEEPEVGSELSDDIESFRSTANYICLVLKDKVKTKYIEPTILRTEDGYQLVAETTKRGNPLFTLRLEDSVEFKVNSIKMAFSFLRKTLGLGSLEGNLKVIKERRISE